MGVLKAFHMCNNAEIWAKWKAKNEKRKGKTKEGSKASEQFYQDLGTTNGKCRINNFAKHGIKKSNAWTKEIKEGKAFVIKGHCKTILKNGSHGIISLKIQFLTEFNDIM